jgi:diaminohydroxyphosphoribosylaminopyrimidine deaminase/5-amino-6-(5-phosphoribosylamino)uracil reductase
MTINHNYYIDLAFQIAEKNLGRTKLNPSVGTVIVKNDSVISSAVTSSNGEPHSEFNALNNLRNCKGASLYTTLEPCTHYGKTPPCINIIIKKKIKNVYYAFEDPDVRTFKKAKKFLTNKGIKTKLIHSKKYSKFYQSYFINKKLSIPFVTGKIAISKDFLTINKKDKWISNEYSRNLVHLFRNRYDCILSTSKSINHDDSLLNCRINGFDNNKPDLFIIDLNLKLKKKLSLNNYLKVRKTFLITSKNNFDRTAAYKKLGYKIIFINKLEDKNDFYSLYKKIYKIGYSRILVEAGLTFLNSLIKTKMIHDLYIFKSNQKLGNKGKNNDTSNYLKKIHPKLLTINLNGDKLLKKELYYV